MAYEHDTPAILYDQFIKLEDEIEAVGRNVKELTKDADAKNADYELLKNTYLLLMYAEEASPDFVGGAGAKGKRTEAQREASYRNRYYEQRLARDLAKGALKAEQSLLDALKAKLTGLQSRKGILLSEIEISARRT